MTAFNRTIQDHETRDMTRAQYTFTIFIPTYNRAHTLPLALESLNEQLFGDFEVIIIDDGSTDHTPELIDRWYKKAAFPLSYAYQDNSGKPSAHNRAVNMASGYFFMTLDSDDSLLPDALEMIVRHWEEIPEKERDQFAGIGGLCLNEDGTLSGTQYPEDVMDSDYLEMSRIDGIRGEKREAIRTDVLREFPYPILEGEKHIRPTMIFRRLSKKYMMRFINVPLQVNRHAPDGITARRFEYRMKNPGGLRLCFLEDITLFSKYFTGKKLWRSHIRYVRYSLHSGVGLIRQAREVTHPFWWLLSLPGGTLKWVRDLQRKKRLGLQ